MGEAEAKLKQCGNIACSSWSKSWFYRGGDRVLCRGCTVRLDNDNCCPYCQQIYRQKDRDGFDGRRWIECSECFRWVHVDCEVKAGFSAAPDLYNLRKRNDNVLYSCATCRGDDEPHDSKAAFTQTVELARLIRQQGIPGVVRRHNFIQQPQSEGHVRTTSASRKRSNISEPISQEAGEREIAQRRPTKRVRPNRLSRTGTLVSGVILPDITVPDSGSSSSSSLRTSPLSPETQTPRPVVTSLLLDRLGPIEKLLNKATRDHNASRTPRANLCRNVIDRDSSKFKPCSRISWFLRSVSDLLEHFPTSKNLPRVDLYDLYHTATETGGFNSVDDWKVVVERLNLHTDGPKSQKLLDACLRRYLAQLHPLHDSDDKDRRRPIVLRKGNGVVKIVL
uniref:ARID domain-containing protein n=1 Tax=Amorphochlora amoebiformis TaxID=1561963 RepID=A0A7S0CRQ2_9EUKA